MYIQLTQGYRTLVDDEDYEELSRHRWCANVGRGGYVYAARRVPVKGRRLLVGMHQYLLGTAGQGRAVQVDHTNHDTLDNRRSNLRLATSKQNTENRAGATRRSSSGHRGVYWHRGASKWAVSLKHHGTTIWGGTFERLEEAVQEAEALRARHFTHDTRGRR